jgi:hypothetical protein
MSSIEPAKAIRWAQLVQLGRSSAGPTRKNIAQTNSQFVPFVNSDLFVFRTEANDRLEAMLEKAPREHVMKCEREYDMRTFLFARDASFLTGRPGRRFIIGPLAQGQAA